MCTSGDAAGSSELCKSWSLPAFFLEDPFPPEDDGYFEMLRQQSGVPIAMGELFNTLTNGCG